MESMRPTYCATNHVHTAIMCESDCGHYHDSYNVSSSLLSDVKKYYLMVKQF